MVSFNKRLAYKPAVYIFHDQQACVIHVILIFDLVLFGWKGMMHRRVKSDSWWMKLGAIL
jgi:hypothetical protein